MIKVGCIIITKIIFPIMPAVGFLSKIVITGNVYIAALTYHAANILIQIAIVDIFLTKNKRKIATKIPNVSKYAMMYSASNNKDKSFLYVDVNSYAGITILNNSNSIPPSICGVLNICLLLQNIPRSMTANIVINGWNEVIKFINNLFFKI